VERIIKSVASKYRYQIFCYFLPHVPSFFPFESLGGPASNNNNHNHNNNNNNNPTPEHHHKGNNQPTEIAGGETTVIKNQKGLKTDQGTTRSPL
jgi:hypothetical protein